MHKQVHIQLLSLWPLCTLWQKGFGNCFYANFSLHIQP